MRLGLGVVLTRQGFCKYKPHILQIRAKSFTDDDDDEDELPPVNLLSGGSADQSPQQLRDPVHYLYKGKTSPLDSSRHLLTSTSSGLTDQPSRSSSRSLTYTSTMVTGCGLRIENLTEARQRVLDRYDTKQRPFTVLPVKRSLCFLENSHITESLIDTTRNSDHRPCLSFLDNRSLCSFSFVKGFSTATTGSTDFRPYFFILKTNPSHFLRQDDRD